MTGINEMAVLAAALLAIAVGSIWYSPLLFGNYWQKAVGLSSEDLSLGGIKLAWTLFLGLIANIVVFLVIAHFVHLFLTQGISLMLLGVGTAVLLSAPVMSMVVWERRTPHYFFIHAGYAVTIVCIGILVLTFWPW
jgi:hypothetical protein